jgi:hypothetical protein
MSKTFLHVGCGSATKTQPRVLDRFRIALKCPFDFVLLCQSLRHVAMCKSILRIYL